MNKMKKNLILLLITLGFVLVATILAVKINSKPTDIAPQATSQQISNYSLGVVTSIDILNELGSFTLYLNDGIWYVKDNEAINLDQSLVDELAYAFTHIQAERILSDAKLGDSQYGLKMPAATIRTHHQGGVSQVYMLGKETPIANEYYLESPTLKQVCTVVSSYYAFSQSSITDLAVMNKINIKDSKISKMEIINALGEAFTMQKVSALNDISLCYWEFIWPFTHDADTAILYGSNVYEGMLMNISSVAGDKIIGSMSNATTTYGIDNPIYSATVFDEAGEHQSFSLGEYGDAENYSLSFSNDEYIYSIKKTYCPFIAYSAYMLADANLSLINIDTVDNLDIDLPGLSTNLSINHTIKKHDNGTDTLDANGDIIYNVDIMITGVTESAIDLDASAIHNQKTWFYQDIVTIKIADVLFDVNSEYKKIGSLFFTLNSEYLVQYLIEIFDYDVTYYLAKKNGEDTGYLINKSYIVKLSDAFNKLKQGNLESPY